MPKSSMDMRTPNSRNCLRIADVLKLDGRKVDRDLYARGHTRRRTPCGAPIHPPARYFRQRNEFDGDIQPRSSGLRRSSNSQAATGNAVRNWRSRALWATPSREGEVLNGPEPGSPRQRTPRSADTASRGVSASETTTKSTLPGLSAPRPDRASACPRRRRSRSSRSSRPGLRERIC